MHTQPGGGVRARIAALTPLGWGSYLVCSLSVAFGHLFIAPDSAASAVAFLAVAVSGLVAVAGGQARRQLAWKLLLAGIGLMVVGDVLWVVQQQVWHSDPFPSVADAFYVPAYPLLGAGLITMIHRRSGGSGRGGVIDATIIATGFSVLAWFFVIGPYFDDVSLTMVQRAVSAAYPLAGVLLVAVVTRLAFVSRSATMPDLLLVAGIVSLLAADIVLGASETNGGYFWHPVSEFLWLAMYVTFGAAALHPRSSHAHAGADDAAQGPANRSDVSRARFAILVGACLIAPALLLLQETDHGDLNVIIMATASALLSVLVLLRMRELLQRVQRQTEELARLATIDPLTGVANRRCWNHEIARFIADAERRGHPLSVALIDLDHFKRYNDTNGHLAGDNLLVVTTMRWRELLRPTDFLARYGGEEFAIALPGTTPCAAVAVLERLREIMPEGQTFSGGIADWVIGDTPEQLLGRADRALYDAKDDGRDSIRRAPLPMADRPRRPQAETAVARR